MDLQGHNNLVALEEFLRPKYIKSSFRCCFFPDVFNVLMCFLFQRFYVYPIIRIRRTKLHKPVNRRFIPVSKFSPLHGTRWTVFISCRPFYELFTVIAISSFFLDCGRRCKLPYVPDTGPAGVPGGRVKNVNRIVSRVFSGHL